MSLRRTTVALLLSTFGISPLCDVTQTSDCGTLVIYFRYKPFMWCRSDVRLWHAPSFIFQNKPFMWCRPDARLRHCLIYFYPFEASFQTLDWPSVLHWDFGWTTARLPFYFPCIAISLSECALLICSFASCLHLLYPMSELSCEYFHSTHLACWFGQMWTKAISWTKSLIVSPTPRGVPVNLVRSWILVTCIIYASATHNKNPRASLRRSMSC